MVNIRDILRLARVCGVHTRKVPTFHCVLSLVPSDRHYPTPTLVYIDAVSHFMLLHRPLPSSHIATSTIVAINEHRRLVVVVYYHCQLCTIAPLKSSSLFAALCPISDARRLAVPVVACCTLTLELKVAA